MRSRETGRGCGGWLHPLFPAVWTLRFLQSDGLVNRRAAANSRRKDKRQQKKRNDSQQPEKQWAHHHPMSAALSTCFRDMREVSAQHIGTPAERFIGLIS